MWLSGTTDLPVNAWTHLAQTYDGTTLRLYVNGVLVVSQAATGTIETNNNPLWIGGNNPYGEYFQGLIDDVRIYNRAPTAGDIQADLNTPVATPQVNTAPTVSAITNRTILEDTGTGALAFTIGDAQTAAGSLTVSGNSSNAALAPAGAIVFGGSGASRTMTLTPLANQSGTATITVTVSDGQASTSTSFQLTVTAVNDPPTISPFSDQITTVAVPSGPLSFTVGDVETAANALTLSAGRSNPTLLPAGNIVFGGGGANRSVTLSPAANQTGTSIVTIAVSDGVAITSTTFQLTVIASVNQQPTISAIANQTMPEDTSTGALAFTVADAETPAVSLAVTGTTSNSGLVPIANIVFGGSGGNRTVIITPAANQSGSATITIMVSDGQTSVPTSFELLVTPVNDAPTSSILPNQTVLLNTSTPAVNFTIGDLETSASSLTVSGGSSNQTLLPVGNILFGGSGVTRTVTVTPANGQTGVAVVTVTVSDGQLSTQKSFQLTVTTISSGLVAAYGFDAGSGTTVSDASGNNNTGTLSGATWTTAGKYGGALVFDGSSARVSVPGSTSLNLTTGMTLEAWVQPTAAQDGWRAIIQREVDAFLLHASNQTGALLPAAGGTFEGSVVWVSGTTDLPVNTWTHLAQTYDGTTIRLYVDGVLVASQAVIGTIETNANPLWIGGNNPYGEYFQGLIDEVRIYNRVLTAAELQTDMSTPVGNAAQLPVLQILQPTEGQLLNGTSIVDVTYTASGNMTGVHRVHFQLDGGPQVMDIAFDGAYRFTNVPAGLHWLMGILVRADHSPIAGSDVTVTFSTTAGSTNTAPTISAIAPQTVPPNTGTGPLSFTVGDAETPAGSLTVSGTTSNVMLIPVGNIVLGGSGAARTVTVTPASGQSGTATITVAVNDGQLSTETTFVLTVTAPPTAGLVAAYSFDAGAGPTVTDVSGNNNTGTLSGATWTTAGKYGGALAFDGSTARVSVPGSTSLNLTPGMTLEAWVQPTAAQSGWRAILQREVDAFFLHASNQTGALQPAAGGTFGGSVSWVSGTTGLPVNAWTHLAQTYDGTTLRLYVNGVLVVSQTTAGTIETNNNPLWIGGNNPYGEHFQGLIDDVRIYNRALTATEIQADLNTPVGGWAPPAALLQIAQPVEGEVLNNTTLVNVTYTATGDLTGVDHVHFKLDALSEVMDADFDGSYQFTNVSAGTHVLQGYLVRLDHVKIPGSDFFVHFSTTLVDGLPPTVSLSAPAQGATLVGVVTLSATASDDVGIAGVQFQMDAANIGFEDTTAPYSIPLNTVTLLNGLHSFRAVARDLVGKLVVSSAISATISNSGTTPSSIGRWDGPYAWPFVAIHMTLLRTGEVLGWDDHTENQGMYLWNPSSNLFQTFPQSPSNLFCSGHTALPDGRILIAGGTGSTFNIGIKNSSIYDPIAKTFSPVAPMTYARYYPTLIGLPNGNAVVFAGTNGCSTCTQDTPELYNRASNTWTPLSGARLALPYYPSIFALPDGRLLATGTSEEPIPTRVLDVNTQTWTLVDTNAQSSGSAVMYVPGKVIRTGTAGNPNVTVQADPTTQVIDMSAPTPQWRTVSPMAFPRSHHNLTLLPDGTVLATGGGRTSNANDTNLAVYEAEIWSPLTETWTTVAAAQKPRLYHGTALLLPDGRVLEAGSGRPIGLGTDQFNAEILSPPYLFKGPRPTITSAPGSLRHGASFFVGTADAVRIAKVTLLRLGTVTHGFNIDQRYLELPYTVTTGGLQIQAPSSANLAPRGYYMLFLVDTNGVPSTASIMRVDP